MDLVLVVALLVGILIGVGIMLIIVGVVAVRNPRKGRTDEVDTSEIFEKMWNSANSKAIEALCLQSKEVPDDFSDPTVSKFIDDKRDRYIEVMLTMKQLTEEDSSI